MPRPHDVHSAKDPLTDTLEASFAHRRLRPEVWLALLGCIAILVVFLYEPEPAKPKTKQPVSAVDGGSTAVSNPNVPAVPAQTDNWIGKFLKDNEADAGSTGATSEAAKKRPAHPKALAPVPDGFVRVAAVQYCPVYGDPELNRKRIESVVGYAASLGVQIAVLPEGSIPGYAEAEEEIYWTADVVGTAGDSGDPGDTTHYTVGTRPVMPVVETPEGETVRTFSPLCKKWKIYLTLPVIEKDGENLYSAAWLMNPEGKIILRVRKEILWREGDSRWATAGSNQQVPVVDTPLGRIGMMITYDMHRLLPIFQEKKVDHVLHICALVGENWGPWLDEKLPVYIHKGNFNLVLANWSHSWAPHWTGYGLSRVIGRDGRHLWRVKHDVGNQLVIADVPQMRGIPFPSAAEEEPSPDGQNATTEGKDMNAGN